MHESMQYVPIGQVAAIPQVRRQFDDESLEGLAASIREVGMLQPIRVRQEGKTWVVIDGERRWRAAKLIGMAEVPVIVEQKPLREAETVHRQLIANLQRADLSALERATGIKQLMDKSGWSAAEVSGKLGLSSASVSKLLALLTLPETIRKRVESGEIPGSAAYELSRVEDADRQEELAQQLAEGRLTRDGLAGNNKASKKRPAKRVEASQPSRVTAMLGESRSVTVASVGLTLERFIEVIEELLAKARRVRTQGVELGTFIKMLKDQARPG